MPTKIILHLLGTNQGKRVLLDKNHITTKTEFANYKRG